jgi:hypothetical protein
VCPRCQDLGQASEEEYELERILNHRQRKGKTQFFVRWKGFTPTHDCWINEDDMGNCQHILEDYKARSMEKTTAAQSLPTEPKKAKSKKKTAVTLEPTPPAVIPVKTKSLPMVDIHDLRQQPLVTNAEPLLNSRPGMATRNRQPAKLTVNRADEATVMLAAAEGVQKVNCTVCGFISRTQKGLRNHMRRHTEGGQQN